jgi:transposase-like protein
MTLDLTDPIFADEDKAREHFETIRWPDGPVCPHCGATSEHVKLMAGRTTRPGLYQCNACREPFTVKMGTVMEASHIPYRKWALGFHLMASSKKGMSAHQLHRMLGVTYKTAWFMAHRIREAMGDHSDVFGPVGGEGMTLEIDETYIGKKAGYEPEPNPWKFSSEFGWYKDRRSIGGTPGKIPVITLVERGGKARSIKAENVTSAEMRRIVFAHADTKSRLMTDQANVYRGIGRQFVSHESVNHSADEWARKLGDGTKAHTNTVEGFFSIFKRGMRGIYQHCSEKHLHRYLAEFDFRYSNRTALGVGDAQRAAKAIKGAQGKRLTYR